MLAHIFKMTIKMEGRVKLKTIWTPLTESNFLAVIEWSIAAIIKQINKIQQDYKTTV